jgi:tropomyosin
LEQEALQKDQEISSLQHKLGLMEQDLEKAEGKLQDHKVSKEEEDSSKSNADILQRKLSMLEEELETTEKNLRETTEKCV